MQIALTILQQIKAFDGTILLRYNADQFKVLSETDKREGGISFTINPYPNPKGIVKIDIELDWRDEYRVSFVGADNVVRKMVKNVHFPELVPVLSWVEKVD